MMEQGYGRHREHGVEPVAQPGGAVGLRGCEGGIVSLTWDLAWELQNYDISVNAIAPMALTRGSVNSGGYHDLVTGAGLVRVKQAYEQARPEPEYVSPMVVYLSSELAAGVTGRVFRVGAGKVGIYSHPTEMRTIYRNFKKDGPWPVEELKDLIPDTVLYSDRKAPHIPGA